MQEFDCLDPNTPLSGKIFIEASAGTGKTFAIEHVVARLILQKYPLDKILITTFTNAGVRDLKQRIYENFQNLLESQNPPPYFHNTPESILALKNALRLIDEAQIYTIHSFCHRMLSEFSFEANIDTTLIDPEKGFKKETLELASLDVLRTLVDSNEFSPAQLSKLMSPFQRSAKNFVKKMTSFLSSNPTLPNYADYKTLLDQFCSISVDKEELYAIAPFYNKTTNRSGTLHPFVEHQIEALANKDFETLIQSTPSIFELFVEENRKKQATVATHPIIQQLSPIMHEASDPFILFCRVAKKVQLRLKAKNEGPNILLETMVHSLSSPVFKQKVSEKFKAIIIDEFQDTDPLQWTIFSSLTAELFLVVGDPKQSIYAFRGADLQTFLSAKKEFSHLYKLSSNYRSDPSLIAHLNKLFQTPELFTLSENSLNFSYEPLQAKKTPSQKLLEETIQFVLSTQEKDEIFFSYIAQEIIRLTNTFSFAILVKDRYQAFRLTAYLQNLGLPVLTTATANITEGPAFNFLLLAAKLLKSPKNRSLAKELLCHPFLSGLSEEILLYEKETLSHLFEIAHIETPEDYTDFTQLISLILEENPPILYKYLERLSLLDPDDHPYLKRRPLSDKNSITIMTSHMSKGLEFDVVFALGPSIKQPPSPLKPLLDQDLEKLRLFYVAATRAKEKLYLFVTITNEDTTSRAPTELVLSKLLHPLAPYKDLPPISLEKTIEALSLHNFPYIQVESPILIEKLPQMTQPQAPPTIHLPEFPPPNQFFSFSSLVESHPTTPVPTNSNIPPGPETGNLFHLLLEKMIETGSYFDWDTPKIQTFIESELFKTHLEGLEPLVYDLIHTAFFTPLTTFCLHDVAPEFMLQEHAFSYILQPRQYMKGFIDLTFLHQDHYYLLDWKLNLLSAYTPETLHTAMQEHSYYTQAQIYKQALLRTLKDHPIKNTFYFFLRGKQNGLVTI